MTTLTGAAGIESCDFYEGTFSGLSPDPAWVEVDANSDCTVGFQNPGTINSYVTLSIPNAADIHNYGSTLGALCLVQPCTNTNFAIEAMFTTNVPEAAAFGLIVTNALGGTPPVPTAWLTFNVYRTLTVHNVETSLTGNFFLDSVVAQTYPLGLRLIRSGDGTAWSTQYKLGAANWSTPVADPAHSITAANVGVFCANFGGAFPAWTQTVDYFFETSAPIANEDQPSTSRIMVIT
jgi:hypothetical protein